MRHSTSSVSSLNTLLPLSSNPSGTTKSASQPQLSEKNAIRTAFSTYAGYAYGGRRRIRTLLSLLAVCILIATYLGHAGVIGRSPVNQQETTEHDSPELKPLTELGFEADLVYENIGSTDLDVYRAELEDFLKRAFPAADSDDEDPNSLISVLRDFLPPPPAFVVNPQQGMQRLLLGSVLPLWNTFRRYWAPPPPVVEQPKSRHTIPTKIHQTGWEAGKRPPGDQYTWQSWTDRNPNHEYAYYDDQAAREFMVTRFNVSLVPGDGRGSVAETYARMKDVPVMQSDFWRYSVLASEGGVYSDLDTVCLKSIEGWHRPLWQRDIDEGAPDPHPLPSLIVGIEQDVGGRSDWHQWYPRPVGIVQWTFAGARGHPVLIDAMRRVQEAVNPLNMSSVEASQRLQEGIHRKLDSVVEKTGPGPFTDSVLRYLGAKYNVTWPALRYLSPSGMLFSDKEIGADVLVLSVTAFSPGVGQFGAGDTNHAAALVQHLFSGSWKEKHG